jgi:hypothetical protein
VDGFGGESSRSIKRERNLLPLEDVSGAKRKVVG